MNRSQRILLPKRRLTISNLLVTARSSSFTRTDAFIERTSPIFTYVNFIFWKPHAMTRLTCSLLCEPNCLRFSNVVIVEVSSRWFEWCNVVFVVVVAAADALEKLFRSCNRLSYLLKFQSLSVRDPSIPSLSLSARLVTWSFLLSFPQHPKWNRKTILRAEVPGRSV